MVKILIYYKNVLLQELVLKSWLINQRSQISYQRYSVGFIFCDNPGKYFTVNFNALLGSVLSCNLSCIVNLQV